MRALISLAVSPGSWDAFEIIGYVEIGLIERERLDQWGVVLEDRLHLFGDFAVNVEPWENKHEFGALPSGDGRRHCRANSETTRLIARRGNDAAFGWIADCHWFTLKGRIVALLYRRVECVHADVDDLANPPFVHLRCGA